jgi:hypothetical protein
LDDPFKTVIPKRISRYFARRGAAAHRAPSAKTTPPIRRIIPEETADVSVPQSRSDSRSVGKDKSSAQLGGRASE